MVEAVWHEARRRREVACGSGEGERDWSWKLGCVPDEIGEYESGGGE